jgi:hypothetical protein
MFKQLAAEYLGMAVSTVAIIAAVSGYASTLASDDDVSALKELHQTDMKTIQKQMIQKNFSDYSDKIQEIQLKPNKSQYEKNLLEYYDDKRKGVALELKNL